MKNSDCSVSSRVLLGVAAGAAVGLAASEASATQITTDPADVTIGAGGTGTGTVFFDPQTGYVGSTQAEGNGLDADFGLGYVNGNATKPVLMPEDGTSTNSYSGEGIFADGYAIRAGTGVPINASTGSISGTGGDLFLNNGGDASSPWQSGSGGFLGLVITNDPNGGTAADLFGWAEVSYNADDSLTLYRFGYDDSGAASTTPSALAPGDVVPEPGSLAAVAALGAAGLLAYRRRRTRGEATLTAADAQA